MSKNADWSITVPEGHELLSHVDATPDEDYPLRILRAHRAMCDSRMTTHPNPALGEKMNELQDKRAAILDAAIAKLSEGEAKYGPGPQRYCAMDDHFYVESPFGPRCISCHKPRDE